MFPRALHPTDIVLFADHCSFLCVSKVFDSILDPDVRYPTCGPSALINHIRQTLRYCFKTGNEMPYSCQFMPRPKTIIPFNNTQYSYIKLKKTPWSESASELYRPRDRCLSAKSLPTFADRRCHVVSVTDPYGLILDFLDRSRYFSIK
jgi:hypothetical protein